MVNQHIKTFFLQKNKAANLTEFRLVDTLKCLSQPQPIPHTNQYASPHTPFSPHLNTTSSYHPRLSHFEQEFALYLMNDCTRVRAHSLYSYLYTHILTENIITSSGVLYTYVSNYKCSYGPLDVHLVCILF